MLHYNIHNQEKRFVFKFMIEREQLCHEKVWSFDYTLENWSAAGTEKSCKNVFSDSGLWNQ